MAASEDKVMEWVQKQLKKNPAVSNQELFAKAKEIDPAVGELSLRQFHAKYPLQVKRKLAPKSGTRGRSRRRRAKELNREAIRESLLKFARDVSAAEGKAETIEILANVDKYVSELADALDGGGRK